MPLAPSAGLAALGPLPQSSRLLVPKFTLITNHNVDGDAAAALGFDIKEPDIAVGMVGEPNAEYSI